MAPEHPTPSMESRYRTLTGFWKWVTIGFSTLGILLAVYHIFYFQGLGFMLMDNSYLYLLMTFYMSMVFLFFPLKKGGSEKIIFAVDVFLFFLTVAVSLYLAVHGLEINTRGWDYFAPTHIMIMSIMLWILVLEAVRRTAGASLAIVILVFSLYPLYAAHMPGFLEGYHRPFTTTANYHALSMSSILGIPMQVFGIILIGFIIFGVALQASGGGQFFLNLSGALLGSRRGGTAKVAVLSSALFGSLSGSVISNVVTTGSITIPAIKKSGYPAHYAGGIECAASTGGVLMPPIMGATAFVMAAFLGVSYGKIALAAAIPSVLAYVGLLIQVDGYAARKGLKGLPKSELPSLIETLKEGWVYFVGIGVLLYVLFIIQLESQAPFLSVIFILVFAMIRKETRFTRRSFLLFIQSTGKLLSELIAILSGVGMILGALALTGVAAAFAREIVALAGGKMIYMLIFGALASFILGMGMTITACYVFLALVLVPALIAVGLNEIAVHLYVMYWGMLSYITPPVALAAFPAAVIAGAKPFRVGLMAMKLGGVKYLIPFFFVFDPALVCQGSIAEIVQAAVSTILGVFFIGSVLEDYLFGVGRIHLRTVRGAFSGAALFVGGFIMGLPGWTMDFLGLAIVLVAIFTMLLTRGFKKERQPVPVMK
jgi:TRAP transporter 4TM/12TM fusion protein